MHGYLSATLAGTPGASALSNGCLRSCKGHAFYPGLRTETGNSKRLATDLAKKAKESGFQVKLVALDSIGSRISQRNRTFSSLSARRGTANACSGIAVFRVHPARAI